MDSLASEEGPVFYTKLGKPNPKIIDVVQEMSKSGDWNYSIALSLSRIPLLLSYKPPKVQRSTVISGVIIASTPLWFSWTPQWRLWLTLLTRSCRGWAHIILQAITSVTSPGQEKHDFVCFFLEVSRFRTKRHYGFQTFSNPTWYI